MRRRQYIGSLAVIVSATLAGCGSLAGLGGPSQEPDEVVEAYVEALDDGDRDDAEERLHSESEGLDISDRECEFWEGVVIDIMDGETVEQAGESEVVEIISG